MPLKNNPACRCLRGRPAEPVDPAAAQRRVRTGRLRTRDAALPAAAATGPTVTKETIDNPYGLEALWKQGDFVAARHAGHHGHHEHGQLVHHLHQAVRAAQAAEERQGCERELLDRGLGEEGPGHARRRQRVPLHRRAGPEGRRAPRRQPGRADRPPHLDHDERAARGRQHRRAACRTAWPSSPPSVRPRRSSACSAPSGASTTR